MESGGGDNCLVCEVMTSIGGNGERVWIPAEGCELAGDQLNSLQPVWLWAAPQRPPMSVWGTAALNNNYFSLVFAYCLNFCQPSYVLVLGSKLYNMQNWSLFPQRLSKSN